MDIYKTPKAPVKDSQPDDQPGSVLKALFVGSMIDIPGSFLVGIILSILAMSALMSQGLNAHDASASLQLDNENSPFSWILSGIGLLMSVNAGYWCARVANRPSYTVPAMQGVISTLASFLMTPHGTMTHLAIILNLTSFPAIMLGAAIFQQRKKSGAS